MPSSTLIFLFSSILILISPVKITSFGSPSPPPLIQRACSNASMNIDTKLCLEVLTSIPSVVSSKDLLQLSVSIIESGISNSTNTLRHVEGVLRDRATDPAFRECKLSYGQIVARFRSALAEVKAKEYVAPTYDLLTASTDCVKRCESALEGRKLGDEIVLRGNRIVPIFGISAFSVVGELDKLTPPPPPPPPRINY